MTIRRWRKKPCVIEAVQWDGTAEGATPIPPECNPHPDAPHGFDRNGSLNGVSPSLLSGLWHLPGRPSPDRGVPARGA